VSLARLELTVLPCSFWEKVVVNLIGNAFKYTLEGRITVSMESSGGHMYFSVADTGVGIPASDISKIFDRFHRVNVGFPSRFSVRA
jgi:signal transduction histidine kinase